MRDLRREIRWLLGVQVTSLMGLAMGRSCSGDLLLSRKAAVKCLLLQGQEAVAVLRQSVGEH